MIRINSGHTKTNSQGILTLGRQLKNSPINAKNTFKKWFENTHRPLIWKWEIIVLYVQWGEQNMSTSEPSSAKENDL